MVDLDAYGLTPQKLLISIAKNEKDKRKRMGMTQAELAKRADVSLPSLRRFEQKGEISLSSLIKIASVLGDQNDFLKLFPRIEYRSMKELLNAEHEVGRSIR